MNVEVEKVIEWQRQLRSALLLELSAAPASTARELVRRLAARGIVIDKSHLNSTLYTHRDQFWCDRSAPPQWHLVGGMKDVRDEPSPETAASRWPFRLYRWQAEALDAWEARQRRGVVEAVTGTGKTMVGLAAAHDELQRGGRVLVLVPSKELLHQWHANAMKFLPGIAVGLLGDGHSNTLASAQLVIAVVNSARLYDTSPPPQCLLIADECHRYGSAQNSKALDPRFPRRLGLSATYARSDDAHQTALDPYFSGPCFQMDYKRAVADGVTAHFKVALVGVEFEPDERQLYDQVNSVANKARKWLVEHQRIPAEPFGEFMRQVSALSKGGGDDATWKARKFLQAFAERRGILAETPRKAQALMGLTAAILAADRVICFTQTIKAAEDAAEALRTQGILAGAIHAALPGDERTALLNRFKEGGLKVIVAPQVLDEGVDVPAADLAVILGASKTNRQMIQRMGRVLRRKEDHRLARFVVVYVNETSEDPARGAHEDFLSEIIDVADEVRSFSAEDEAAEACAYLNAFGATGATSVVPRYSS